MEVETSWLADGVREINKLAKAAMVVKPELLPLPAEKIGTYAVITPGPSGSPSTVNPLIAKPDWHNEWLDTPDQLKAFIFALIQRNEAIKKDIDGAVYVAREKVIAVYDFEDRRDRAWCPLKISQPWAWLSTSQPPLDQRSLIRALRIIFDGCLPSDSNLIRVLRNVKWKSDGMVEANLQRGKESLGRNILNEVGGITDFPEEFTLRVKPFENVDFFVLVRVALEIMPDVQRFEVIPFPNQLADGMDLALERIRASLAETGIPAFIGGVGVGIKVGS